MADLSRWGVILLSSTLLLALLAGCAPSVSPVAWQPGAEDWVFPFPPEQPRIRFLRQIAGLDDIRDKDAAGQRLFKWLGAEEVTQIPMVSPYGVAADGEGRIWVSDPGAAVVHALDLARQKIDYISVVGQRKLQAPVGAVYNSHLQRLYISDAVLLEIFMFDAENNYLGSFKPEFLFGRVGGLALDRSGQVYAADVLAGTVEVFSAAGEHLKSLGSRVAENGKFNRPSNIAVDAEGRVYVVDSLRFRVEILGLSGESPIIIGGLGDAAGSFARPRGVALDSAGHVYVSDAAFDNVQVFNRQGKLLLIIGRNQKGPDQFCMPAGLSYDSFNRLYVADSCGYRVKIFQFLGD